MLRIGIDFDNTIAGYDHAFSMAARDGGLLPETFAGTKKDVRDAVRRLAEGERKWMTLQGRVYSAHMADAVLIGGVADFLNRCRDRGVEVCIISHKTEFGHFDPDRVNLRDAGFAWMAAKGFFDPDRFGICRDRVFFEPTRDAKIARIASLRCTDFIDDLEEIFREPAFPASVAAYLLAAGTGPLPRGPFKAYRTWQDISDDILGDPR